ncbi:MAG: hypothetical protein HYV24_00655 [Deltaproteobacteria bacterium]|nr:hypothetical protein [Deltaproteobacteria bacterium]
MKKSKGKASPGAAKGGKDACIIFKKGERIELKSSILPKSCRETDKAPGDKNCELVEDIKGDNK